MTMTSAIQVQVAPQAQAQSPTVSTVYPTAPATTPTTRTSTCSPEESRSQVSSNLFIDDDNLVPTSTTARIQYCGRLACSRIEVCLWMIVATCFSCGLGLLLGGYHLNHSYEGSDPRLTGAIVMMILGTISLAFGTSVCAFAIGSSLQRWFPCLV